MYTGDRVTWGTGEGLDSIVARAALPIGVTYAGFRWWLTKPFGDLGAHQIVDYSVDPRAITDSYLDLVATFPVSDPGSCISPCGSDTGESSPPVALGAGADCPPTSAPSFFLSEGGR